MLYDWYCADSASWPHCGVYLVDEERVVAWFPPDEAGQAAAGDMALRLNKGNRLDA
jgi:hypothetical protein